MNGYLCQIWTPENLDKLRAGVLAGLSCSQMAEQIPGATRGAVAGKVRRMGWANDRPPRPPRKPAQSGWQRWKNRKGLTYRARAVDSERFNGDGTQPFRNISLIELEHGECHWPSEGRRIDGDHGFCGQRALPDQPYCGFHLKLGTVNITRKSSDIVKVLQREGVPR